MSLSRDAWTFDGDRKNTPDDEDANARYATLAAQSFWDEVYTSAPSKTSSGDDAVVGALAASAAAAVGAALLKMRKTPDAVGAPKAGKEPAGKELGAKNLAKNPQLKRLSHLRLGWAPR